jgi:hypothetical protein
MILESHSPVFHGERGIGKIDFVLKSPPMSRTVTSGHVWSIKLLNGNMGRGLAQCSSHFFHAALLVA